MIADVQKTTQLIVFEQPINEHVRICLRLEQLLHQLNNFLPNTSASDAQMATLTILRIVDVIDRADIKSKLTQMLTQYATTLGQLERFPQVDIQRLQHILAQLDSQIQLLHQTKGRIGDILRANEFLNQLRPQLSHPGGIFLHHAPSFALWLRQPAEVRGRDLTLWKEALNPLPAISKLVLELTRNSTNPQNVTTQHGFYHQSLDSTLPCYLIRVAIPDHLGIYAEISAGKHRLSIRFLKPSYIAGERPKQITDPVTFELNICRF